MSAKNIFFFLSLKHVCLCLGRTAWWRFFRSKPRQKEAAAKVQRTAAAAATAAAALRTAVAAAAAVALRKAWTETDP